LVTADEFRGEVLRLLGAAAVAAGQQAPASDENLGGSLSPNLQPRYVGLEREQRCDQPGQVGIGHETPSALIVLPRSWACRMKA
jgi:hypothetical protein